MAIGLSENAHILLEERFGYSFQNKIVASPEGQVEKTHDSSSQSTYFYNDLGSLFGNKLDSLRKSIGANLLRGIMPNGNRMSGGEIFSLDGHDYAWSGRNEVAYRLGKTGENFDRVGVSCNLHKKIQAREVGSIVEENGYKFLVVFAHDKLCVPDITKQAIKLDHGISRARSKEDGLLFMSNGNLKMWYTEMVFEVLSAKRID
jgi:hypothetical protein